MYNTHMCYENQPSTTPGGSHICLKASNRNDKIQLKKKLNRNVYYFVRNGLPVSKQKKNIWKKNRTPLTPL